MNKDDLNGAECQYCEEGISNEEYNTKEDNWTCIPCEGSGLNFDLMCPDCCDAPTMVYRDGTRSEWCRGCFGSDNEAAEEENYEQQ